MVITNNQLASLDQISQKEFEKRMMEFVIENYPTTVLGYDDKTLQNKIKFLIEEAHRFDLEYEEDIEDYIDILFDNNYQDVVKQEPSFEEIMTWPDRTPSTKLEYLREYLMFDVEKK